ncbi:MAG: flagellar biosynthesis protein FlgN [Pseudomonadota bacterium]
MDRKQSRLADELEDLLDKEYDVLRSGTIADIPRLADQKARLMSGLQASAGMVALGRVREKATRNARLLEAAAAGIRSVTDRVTALRAGPQTFTTYSADGARSTVGSNGRTIEKRA